MAWPNNSDLTEWLVVKLLAYNQDSPKVVITSAAGQTISNTGVRRLSWE